MSAANNQPMGGDSAAATISVAAIIFFFMVVVLAAFFYLYAKRHLPSAFRARYRASFAFAGTAAELGPATVPGRGLDGSVLRSLPVTVYRAADFKEGVECAVCLSELADGEAARLLPTCGHGFHLKCIDMWFHSHSTCPLCRSPVGAGSTRVPSSETAEESPPVISSSASSATAEVATGASSSGGSASRKPPGGMLAIEVPRRAVEGGFRPPVLPLLASRADMEEMASPVSATFRTLRRLWSQGRCSPAASTCSPRGGDVEQGEASSSADGRGKY
ncbi:E3 ubiquitin-protein ligase [Canna indica]|uniref:RING-type E3 ubiquitin transferase n=1 Tax=Canna indica TaxID=4628 RepID=A0AAQ3KGM3_9LILI|nr:E3 ubiquitin-protein ligase [Canna indica]